MTLFFFSSIMFESLGHACSLCVLAFQVVSGVDLFSWHGIETGSVSCLLAPTFSRPLLSSHTLSVGQTVGHRVDAWVGIPILLLVFLVSYRRQPVQAIFPFLLGVLTGVILVGSWECLLHQVSTWPPNALPFPVISFSILGMPLSPTWWLTSRIPSSQWALGIRSSCSHGPYPRTHMTRPDQFNLLSRHKHILIPNCEVFFQTIFIFISFTAYYTVTFIHLNSYLSVYYKIVF